MPIDTFFAFSGVYANVDDALADYEAVHQLHTEIGLIDAYDAAVIERKADGKALAKPCGPAEQGKQDPHRGVEGLRQSQGAGHAEALLFVEDLPGRRVVERGETAVLHHEEFAVVGEW